MTSTYPTRDKWIDVVVAQRDAVERLLAEDLSPAVLKVGIAVITRLSSYSRFKETIRIQQLVDLTGLVRETVGRALNKLHRLGIIGWQAGKARAQSWVALDPGALNETDVVPSKETSAVPPVREVLIEESSKRESVQPDDELTISEAHEVDCSFAATSIVEHLLPDESDQSTLGVIRHRAFRAFQRAEPGRVGQLLNLALQGRPARHIDSPTHYVERWVKNAHDDLQVLDTLATTPRVLTTQSQCR